MFAAPGSALIGFSLLLLSALIPGKDTIYMMAGSEFGEHAAQTERGQELVDRINEVIDAQLERLAE